MKKSSSTMLNPADGASWVLAAASRACLLFIALVVVAMPFTEYLWHFDKFLRGGQDFELGLLSCATILCLSMVLLQHDKSSVSLSLSSRKWLSFVFRPDDHVTPGSWIGLIAALHAIVVPSPSLSQYSLPQQI
jgi:hypothetical protein